MSTDLTIDTDSGVVCKEIVTGTNYGSFYKRGI